VRERKEGKKEERKRGEGEGGKKKLKVMLD
jgi:hypothetical protein